MQELHDFAVVGKFNRKQSDGVTSILRSVRTEVWCKGEGSDFKVKKMEGALKIANLNLPIILSMDANCSLRS